MVTAVVQICNTDNKLTQTEWSHFCVTMRAVIRENVHQVHFSGGSSFDDPWQKACWVCEVMNDQIAALTDAVSECRKQFNQDSAAITWGDTTLV